MDNCQFQIHGIDIQKHIFDEIIPYCPHCRPDKSDLTYLIQTKTELLHASNEKGNILQIRCLKYYAQHSGTIRAKHATQK